MDEAPSPELLWEDADPRQELATRFGFATPDEARAWAERLLADRYARRLRSVDRLVISHDNLMVWATVESEVATDERLIVKACRRVERHDRLAACADLVTWLGERGVPVATPLAAGDEHQITSGTFTVGVQPVLPGNLLDATDIDQVRVAGAALADLHRHLVDWPGSARLEAAGTSRRPVFSVGDRASEAAPDLAALIRQRAEALPSLPTQVVHSDFRAANLLVSDGRIVGILDFEEAYVGPAVVDLAQSVCMIGTWFHDWAPVSADAQGAFVDSYVARRPLSEDERAWLDPAIGWIMLGMGWIDEARRRLY